MNTPTRRVARSIADGCVRTGCGDHGRGHRREPRGVGSRRHRRRSDAGRRRTVFGEGLRAVVRKRMEEMQAKAAEKR